MLKLARAVCCELPLVPLYGGQMNNDLEVCAHPVDELLGCGGTIACHEDAGDQLQVLIAAEGASPRLDSHERHDVTRGI